MTAVTKVSVVLATRNRSKTLARTLERLSELDTPGFEATVIVADNGSSDDTKATLARASARAPVISVFVEEAGKNRALNRALELADGDLVVFTDDDVLPATDWLAQLVAATGRWPEADIFGGPILLALPPGASDHLVDPRKWGVNFSRYAPRHAEGPTQETPRGANFAVRPRLLDSFAFNESVGPDGTPDYATGSETEFLLRAQGAGHVMIFAPSARLWHIVRPEQLTRPALAGRSYRIGRGWARRNRPPAEVPTILAVPRWIWRAWLGAGVTLLAARLSPGPCPIGPFLRYHRLRGMLAEYRHAGRTGP